ncbi:MAG: hypothetical protein EOM23_06445, partial [Candidatus Moranbacteria bacterium]|nr:hypothetical protein [Candidatus Moranbacteria bacterium]
MKTNAKHIERIIFAILVPTLLVAVLVLCAWLYQSNVLEQISARKDRLLFLPGSEQSRVFLAGIDRHFDVLDKYAARFSGTEQSGNSQTLNEINASAGDLGFSYITIVGKDAILYIDINNTVDISELECWQSASEGRRMLQKIDFNDELRFAFAVPFEVNGESEGAVIGFCTEEGMQNLLMSDGIEGSSAAVVFDSSGEIIAQTGNEQLFMGESNVINIYEKLISDNAILNMNQGGSDDSFITGERGVISPEPTNSDTYYAYQSIGINDWYILNTVKKAFLDRELSIAGIIGPVSIAVVIIIAILLISIMVIIARERNLEFNKEHLKRVEACTLDPLTKLFNKPGFEAEARKSLNKLPKERACAIVSYEIVSFRTYNTLYGYE